MNTFISWKSLFSLLSIFIVLVLALPFFWMIFASFKTNIEIFSHQDFFPKEWNLKYYQMFFEHSHHFLDYFFNSFFISICQTTLALVLSIPCAFIFTYYSFKGKKTLLLIFLTLIFIPKQILALPFFEWMYTLNLLDNSTPIIFSGALSGIALLYFIQVFKKIPVSFIDSLRIEGVHEFRLLFYVLPSLKSSCIAYFFIHFILSWNEYLIPLLILQSQDKKTLVLSIGQISGNLREPYALIMIAGILAILPVSLLYFLTQKHFYSALKKIH